ncbi:MAG: MFS transporter [Clostridia bacterium]|nr:MFS transporter [Clostridia bacterium]
MKYRHLTNKKTGTLLFLLCWALYCCCYFGRHNFSAALAGIITEGVLSKTQGGTISFCFFICYGVGQVINGALGDRFSPFKMLTIGLALTASANILMSFITSPLLMTIIWAANGFAQAMMWPPILIIFSQILHEEQSHKAYVNISTAIPIGTLGTYLTSVAIMKYFDWRGVFVFAGVLLSLMLIVFVIVSLSVKSQIIREKCEEEEITKAENSGEKQNMLRLFMVSGLVFTSVSVAIHGMLKDGVTTWVPTMITEVYALSPSVSVLFTTLLPVVNLTGTYAAAYVYKKFIKNEMLGSILFFTIALPPLISMLFIGKMPPLLASALLSVVTSSMFGANYLAINLMPLHFERFGRVSTVSGALNGIAYIGCAISNYGFGWLSERFGWTTVTLSWVTVCVIAIIFYFISIPRWKRFCKE